MSAGLGYYNAGNESGVAAGTKGIVLSLRKDIRPIDPRTGIKEGGVMPMPNKNGPVDLKLEVVVIGVSDVDRAKAFYEKLGWRLGADFVTGDRKSTRLNSSHMSISYAVFCL